MKCIPCISLPFWFVCLKIKYTALCCFVCFLVLNDERRHIIGLRKQNAREATIFVRNDVSCPICVVFHKVRSIFRNYILLHWTERTNEKLKKKIKHFTSEHSETHTRVHTIIDHLSSPNERGGFNIYESAIATPHLLLCVLGCIF